MHQYFKTILHSKERRIRIESGFVEKMNVFEDERPNK